MSRKLAHPGRGAEDPGDEARDTQVGVQRCPVEAEAERRELHLGQLGRGRIFKPLQ